MSENQPTEIGSQESTRNWKKIQKKFEITQEVSNITPETNVDDAIRRIRKQQRTYHESRELYLCRNKKLRNSGLKAADWVRYTDHYELLPDADGQKSNEFTDADRNYILEKLPPGIELFVHPQLHKNSEQIFEITGEKIGQSDQYWDVYVKNSTPQQA